MNRQRSMRRLLMPLCLVLLVVPFSLQPVRAQAVSESQVKAAYLYNFAKFVEWPNATLDDNSVPIRLCIFSDRAFEQQVNEIVKDKSVRGHPVVVVRVTNGEESRDCQILFIGSSKDRQALRIIEILHGASVLTVGETADFLEDGGIINFVLQDNRVRFRVNHKAATQAGLRVSSRLLSLAQTVIE